MEQTQERTGAPAGATTTTEQVSAERAAADAGNVADFLQSSRDARVGKPHEAVTRERKEPPKAEAKPSKWDKPAGDERPVSGKAGEAAKGPSAADREADDRIRRIVSEATEGLRRENAELKGRLDQATRTGQPGGDKPKADAGAQRQPWQLTKKEIAAYQAMPGAPKLDDKDASGEFLFDSANEHSIALSAFISAKQSEERQQAGRRDQGVAEWSKKQGERFTTFGSRIKAWTEANADKLVDREVTAPDGSKSVVKVPPTSDEVRGLYGWSTLAHVNKLRADAGQQPIPPSVDHGIAEHLYDSDTPVEVAIYLSEHPDELKYLRGANSERELSARFGRVEERATRGIGAAKPAESAAVGQNGKNQKPKTEPEAKREAERAVDRSVSSVKPPDTTLGRGTPSVDGEAEAIHSGDIGSFLAIQREKRAEAAGFRRR